jgi:hypothetical protein
MKTLVDDFSVLAVEKCLLQELPQPFSPKAVISLDDSTISDIAAETEESTAEGERANEKLRVLGAALTVLKGLRQLHPSGSTSSCPLSSQKRSDSRKIWQ